ncbi:hypothetical protein K450DRAFT_252311 [Umbelopsis ramanniana AG]|uniref:C2H2-type domain-containing protein n=1 Tax=Umbelopsis ramanniana AG TaxID=1314678 RepID=A0AAD5HCQ0_UMBRA|nr:uncharacterized protein K450DRAFT_252311 [Umbelopsis ramanniana AG]KAI8577413.1 hypothetical protein K450DRAFT_252311 [Umbelopsis ramanniana AG]
MTIPFANYSIGAFIQQVFGSSAPQPSDQQALYPRIVNLPSNTMGPSTLDHSAYPEDMDDQRLDYSSITSPHIEITPAHHAGYMNFMPAHGHSDSEPLATSRAYLSSFYLSENSYPDSYSSISEASFTETPHNAAYNDNGSYLHAAMQQHYQDMSETVDGNFCQQEAFFGDDFNFADVLGGKDDVPSPFNAHLIPPSDFQPEPQVKSSRSLLSALFPATSGGTMANTSPMSECSSHLSASSPQFSDFTASTFSSPAQPSLSPATISTSLERSGYSLTRAGSSGKIRKPSPDLYSYADQYGKRRYKCKDCDYTSARPNNLREHQGRHNPNRPKPWQCRICDRAFPRKNDCKRHFVKVHMKMNEEDNPVQYAFLQEQLRQSIEPRFQPRSRPQG